MKCLKKISIVITAVFVIHTVCFASGDVKFVNAQDEKPKFSIFSLFKKKPTYAKPLLIDPVNTEVLSEEDKEQLGEPVSTDDESNIPSKETTVTQNADEFTAQDGMLDVTQNTPKNGSLSSTVPGTEDVIFAIVTQPQKGTVEITDAVAGDFVYTPNQDEVGDDAFVFSVTSDTLGQKTATISVTIAPAEEGPTPSPGESPTPTPTATPSPTPSYSFRYEDMIGHWAETSALKLGEDNILKGFKIGQKYFFYPETDLTRGDFILYLVSALGIDVSAYSEVPSPFADAEDTPAWMNLQAKAAYDAGIIKGSQEGDKIYLNANEKLTRLESIAMLNNTIRPDVASVEEVNYTDMYLVPQWGVGYIQNMTGYGLLKGYDDGTVRPFAKITRAMAVEMINQTLMYKAEHPEVINELKAEMDKNMNY